MHTGEKREKSEKQRINAHVDKKKRKIRKVENKRACG